MVREENIYRVKVFKTKLICRKSRLLILPFTKKIEWGISTNFYGRGSNLNRLFYKSSNARGLSGSKDDEAVN